MAKRCFTLVELLIVVIIIAVIAAIAIPQIQNSRQRSREAALRGQLDLVRKAMDRFRADTGYCVEDLGDLCKEPAAFEAERKNGMDSQGNNVAVPPGTFKGPYLNRSGLIYVTAKRAFGGYTTAQFYVPADPITGEQFDCYFSAGETKIRSTSGDRGSDGRRYNTW